MPSSADDPAFMRAMRGMGEPPRFFPGTSRALSARRHQGTGRLLAVATTIGLALFLTSCSTENVTPAVDTPQPTTESRSDTITDVADPVPPGPVLDLLPTPDPASAEVTLDDGAVSMAVIGPEGGVIEATGADGLLYRLAIPARFLSDEIEIVMTPIADLTSPILSGFSGGVQLEPEGLMFPGIATLEIIGTDAVTSVASFTYLGDGEEVALGWADLNGETLHLPISHFSGAGAGTPAPGAGERSPSAPLRAMGTALTAAYRENDFHCIDSAHPLGSVLEAWYQATFESHVEPALVQAKSNDLVLASAIRSALHWWAARQHYAGLICDDLVDDLDNVPGVDRAEDLMIDGLTNAIDTAANSCATTHDLGETKHMFAWAAVSQLMLQEEEMHDLTRLALERAQGCLSFELQFSSHVEVSEPGLTFTAEMTSTIKPLLPTAQAIALGWIGKEDSGEVFGRLAYTPKIESTAYQSCPIEITNIKTSMASAVLPDLPIPDPTRQVPIKVNEEATQGDHQTSPPTTQPNTFMLIFFPLSGSEFFDATCTDLFGGTNPDGAWGPFTFNGLHEDEMNPVWNGFSIKLERGPGKLYGRATYDESRSEGGADISELTTFDLFHDAPRVP